VADDSSRRRRYGAKRDDLTGEHRFGDTGQAICAVVFAAVWIIDSFVLGWTTQLNDVVPNAVRAPVGLVVLAVSGYLAVASLRIVFGTVRETPSVIRTGVFRWVRHPMYLSEVLLYLGLLVISMSAAAAIVWIGAIVFLASLCRHEERLLIDRFGDEYRAYTREVPMWIPRIRARRR
jgi:protein-S-isoprenylcysteine O-methyltransferase Ste14